MQQMMGSHNYCHNHPKRAAFYKCENCGEYFCDKCILTSGDGRPVCRGCAVQLGWPNTRSGGLTAVGIIAIIFGSIGVLSIFFVLMSQKLVKNLSRGAEYETMQKLSEGPIAMFFLIFTACTWILLLCSGIGLLKLKRWAFGAVVTYCVLDVFQIAVNMIRTFSILDSIPPFMRGMIVGSLVGSAALGLALAVLFLVFITRPAIRTQLRA